MTKIIEFALSTKGINDAIKQVRQHQLWIEEKKTELMRRLVETGANVARIEFSNALYSGVNDVGVSVSLIGNEATITANGQAVAFIEFGSGVAYGHGYLGSKPPGISPIGTYDKGKGSNPKGWVYIGERGNNAIPIGDKGNVFLTKGNPPAMAMYKAGREIQQQLVSIAREVFR